VKRKKNLWIERGTTDPCRRARRL